MDNSRIKHLKFVALTVTAYICFVSINMDNILQINKDSQYLSNLGRSMGNFVLSHSQNSAITNLKPKSFAPNKLLRLIGKSCTDDVQSSVSIEAGVCGLGQSRGLRKGRDLQICAC